MSDPCILGIDPKEKGAPAVATQDGPDSDITTIDPHGIIEPSYKAQAKIEMICDEIGWVVSPMIATLEAALAMREAGNIPGLIYSLRCCQAYWKNITINARDLVALQNGEASQ